MEKYGEIFLETENTFRIICDLCSDTFLTLENFRYHIFKHIKNDSDDDSTDSFLDFIFKDTSDSEEVIEEVEVHQENANKEIIFDENEGNIEDINRSMENVLETNQLNIFEVVKSPQNESTYLVSTNYRNDIDNIPETNQKVFKEPEYHTDTDDSVKSFENLEQKLEHDFNILKDKLKNIFKLFKDYCPICLHTFTSAASLTTHTRVHLRNQTKEEIIQFYKNSIKNIKNRNIRNNNRTLTIKSTDAWEKSKKMKCLYCEKKFVHDNDLKRHTRIHLQNNIQKLNCKLCNNKETIFNSNYKYSVHMLECHNIEKPFECDRCPQKFKKYSFLSRHIRFHNDDKRYKCEYCNKSFMENSQRKLHIRSHHTYESLYQCDECGRTFTSLTEFKTHKLRHANKREFNCTKCNKSFLTRDSLKNHFVGVHTNEKPFECNICHAKFGMRGALWTHSRLHSNEKKYKCTICGKAFVQSAGLHSHMKTHYSKEKIMDQDNEILTQH